MKVYIISEGKLNSGCEASVRCVCINERLAQNLVKFHSNNNCNLEITELEVFDIKKFEYEE
jgi:hypothetical protein